MGGTLETTQTCLWTGEMGAQPWTLPSASRELVTQSRLEPGVRGSQCVLLVPLKMAVGTPC